jgi:hypothetical protein
MTWKQLLLVVVAASLAVLATGRAQTSSGANPVYEYRAIVLRDAMEGYGEPELNKVGRDGWELVTVRDVGGQAGVVYLKRRK